MGMLPDIPEAINAQRVREQESTLTAHASSSASSASPAASSSPPPLDLSRGREEAERGEKDAK